MGTVQATILETSPLVDAVRVAVDGTVTDPSYAGQAGQIDGMAEMAEVLRSEVDRFLTQLRA